MEWDGEWDSPTEALITVVIILPLTMDMADITIPTIIQAGDMADTMDTPITEVPTGADTTMDSTTDTTADYTVTAIILSNITATGGWITGTMPAIPGPQRPLSEVQKESQQPIPGTGAAPVG